MKIAINCAFFRPKGGGIKEYIHNLVVNLHKIDKDNEYILYVMGDQYEYAKDNLPSSFRIKIIPFSGDSTFRAIRRNLLEPLFWRKEEKREKWDLFHSPFFHSPTFRDTKVLLTVHDMRFIRYPETYAFFRCQFLKYAVRRSIKKAERIIAISNFTKGEIINAYGTNPDKITVVHEAVNVSHFKLGVLNSSDAKTVSNLEGVPFVLTVGHLEPRKNYDRLIMAFNLIRSKLRNQSTRLVIVGKKGNGYDSTLRLIKQTPGVEYMDFVSNDILAWLYGHASLFVFPSIYEGFGFPPLEAAVNGVISAVSNESCIPEICGDKVAYFNPYDVDSIGSTMQQCLEDESLRNRLKSGLERFISSYSWEKNARETLAIYKEI